jgi:hypothetical protein
VQKGLLGCTFCSSSCAETVFLVRIPVEAAHPHLPC